MDLGPLAKLLIAAGIALVAIGVLLLVWPKLSAFGLGRLPGDLVVKRDRFHFYFPLATCLLVSVVASAVLWVVSRLLRK